jgi:predicted XRE-type DNA-binding protein
MQSEPPIDWAQVVADLVTAGSTQVQIAAALDVSQSTISDIARGASKRPSYDVGSKLLKLHAERVQGRQAA